jgi:hypothetical protein
MTAQLCVTECFVHCDAISYNVYTEYFEVDFVVIPTPVSAARDMVSFSYSEF